MGRELARRATAFDMKVWGVTRSGHGNTTYVEKIVPVSELHQVLTLLDETALARALKEQKLGGAALDVMAIEPLAADSPLWKTPHLMITPHTSAVSDRLWKRQTEILLELLERWFGGCELFNRVDLSRGY